MKIIMHIDFNSFFASVEQQANPFLRGKPIAVAGKGRNNMDGKPQDVSALRYERSIVTTASREAKKLGIKTAMSTIEAKQMIPNLEIIPGDPRKYAEITKRFLAILRRYADSVEQFSADEAFADVTCAAQDYFGAVMLAQLIRDDVAKECGAYCTASIGIGPNKLIAKLAGESVKPSGLTVVRPEEVEAFVLTRELQDICGIGPRTAAHLKELGIESTAKLRETPRSTLVHHFKSYGHFLYNASRGLGPDEVQYERVPEKSIGHSYTFPYDLETDIELQTNLLALCDKVAWRLRKGNFVGSVVSVYVRYHGFSGNGAHRKISVPISDGLELYKNAWTILQEIRDVHAPVRLLGVSLSSLVRMHAPSSLFRKDQKTAETIQALDTLQTRYGAGIWQRASTLKTVMLERIGGWHYDHELSESRSKIAS
ncbi:MAG: DNA polymerase IV [Patescibacteria group bacterium]